jgi:hypothetical protein
MFTCYQLGSRRSLYVEDTSDLRQRRLTIRTSERNSVVKSECVCTVTRQQRAIDMRSFSSLPFGNETRCHGGPACYSLTRRCVPDATNIEGKRRYLVMQYHRYGSWFGAAVGGNEQHRSSQVTTQLREPHISYWGSVFVTCCYVSCEKAASAGTRPTAHIIASCLNLPVTMDALQIQTGPDLCSSGLK